MNFFVKNTDFGITSQMTFLAIFNTTSSRGKINSFSSFCFHTYIWYNDFDLSISPLCMHTDLFCKKLRFWNHTPNNVLGDFSYNIFSSEKKRVFDSKFSYQHTLIIIWSLNFLKLYNHWFCKRKQNKKITPRRCIFSSYKINFPR